jgi:hypothetical protein
MESRIHETEVRDGQFAGCAERDIIELDEVSKVIGELRNWADRFALASWVETEAEALSYSVGMEEWFDEKTESNPGIILSVLGYSYTIGIFSSEEIVRQCRTNDAFSALSDGNFLFRQELTRFRRRNRRLLIELIGRVFVRVVSEWYGLGGTEVAPYIVSYLRRMAIDRLDIARHLDAVDV